jgi:hypothetical protein
MSKLASTNFGQIKRQTYPEDDCMHSYFEKYCLSGSIPWDQCVFLPQELRQ